LRVFGNFGYRVPSGAEHGGRRPDHIEGTAPAAEFDLSEDDLSVIHNELMQDVDNNKE
jgi:hypothetical protein